MAKRPRVKTQRTGRSKSRRADKVRRRITTLVTDARQQMNYDPRALMVPREMGIREFEDLRDAIDDYIAEGGGES